jgi:Protein of unknown function (DUF3102)
MAMVTAMSDDIDITTSNSLADLAGRIHTEHEASLAAVKSGIEHAINAGRLLLEAKAQVSHGQWLPWLREYAKLSDRTARDYMHLARHAAAAPDDSKSISAASADLTNGAIKLPVPPELPDNLDDWDWEEFSAWMQQQLEGPFAAFDFATADRFDWLKTKIMHQAKVPLWADFCLKIEITDDDDDLPPLRLCPFDDLVEAAKALAPIADHKRALAFDSLSFDSMLDLQRAIIEIKLLSTWLLGGLLNEIRYRDEISDKRYEREWTKTHQRLMAHLDQEIAEHEKRNPRDDH